MKIYHGSENIIEKPIFGYGKSYNDYGLGFYCTKDYELAMEWAVDSDRDGYSNAYELDLDGLVIIDLNDERYNTLNWLAILLQNRVFDTNSPIAYEAKRFLLDNYLPEYQNADIISGYRADDSYFSFASDFINNTISLEQLTKAMHYGNLGEQIVLKSEKAFDRIKHIKSDKADKDIWYPKKESRDKCARQKYYNVEKNKFRPGDTYVINILQEGMK